MIDAKTERNPLEVLADEFVLRYRQGDNPSVDEYASTYPDLAAEIERLFPTILAMEQLKRQSATSSGELADIQSSQPERLGDYRIVREIGRGGMGVVYEAEQQSLSRRVAVKVLPPQVLPNSKQYQRFRREARTVARLHHSNIVQVLGVGEQDGLHYFVMQLIRGVGLDAIVDHLKNPDSANGVQPGEESDADFSATDAARAMLSDRLSGDITFSDSGRLSDSERINDTQASSDTTGSQSPASDAPSFRDAPESHAGMMTDASRLDTKRENKPPPENEGVADPPVRVNRDYWKSVARIGAQVADALQYAHSQNIFHRDIKPGNLLLDARGVVWVTDFGLAKALAHDDVSQTGDIVGTLRYMAPEQFNGRCDARSDVYSLGLTLYELVTLCPAFDEEDKHKLIQQVTQHEATPPSKLKPGVPRDLETIILKALARDPLHRYQSADDLAGDLHRFLENRPIRARRINPVERLWRWSRRNPAIACMTALLLFVMLGAFGLVTWNWRQAELEKERAIAENTRAEGNLSLALESMNEMLDQFATNWMAHPTVARLDEEDEAPEFQLVASKGSVEILQKALEFYRRFAERNEANPNLQNDTAKANRRIGELHHRLGQYEEAVEAYREAVDIYQSLSQDFSDDSQYRLETGATLNDLGRVYLMLGRLDESEKSHRQAMDHLVAASKDVPTPQVRFELARTYNLLSRMYWKLGSREEVENYRRLAVKLLEELVASDSKNTEYRLALAHGYKNLNPRSPQLRDKATKILEELVADHPDVPDYQCELSESLAMSIMMHRKNVDVDELDKTLRRSVDLSADLTHQYPTIPRYRAAQAMAEQAYSMLLKRTDRKVEAEQMQRDAVWIYDALANDFPSVPVYRMLLARSYSALSDMLKNDGRLPDAREAIETAILNQEKFVKMRDITLGKRALAWQYHQLAATLNALGEHADAEQAEKQSAALWAECEKKHPSHGRSRSGRSTRDPRGRPKEKKPAA